MGYQVSKAEKTWRLQFQSKGAPRTINKRSKEALNAGFRPDMSLAEAKDHAKSLRARGKLKAQVEKEGRTTARLEASRLLTTAYLPVAHILAFEGYCKERNKFNPSHWRTTQEIIRLLAREPGEWGGDDSQVVYAKMVERGGISPNYSKKIRDYLNRYGKFISKRNKTFFDPIKGPSPSMRRQLEKTRRIKSGKSDPLRPYMLEQEKAQFTVAQYNWLYLSVWLGLRPREVDNLRAQNRELWYWGEGFLRVYQEKLAERGTDTAKCWKGIPLQWPEQSRVREIIMSGDFKQPHAKKIQGVFGERFTAYGGRKGFVALVMERENDIYLAQKWLGHQSILETQKSYEEVKDVVWSKKAA